MAKAKFNTRDMVRKMKLNPKRVATAKSWIEAVMSTTIDDDLFDALKDGVILCQLMNKFKKNSCKKFKPSKVAFVARSNIEIYLKAVKKYGVKETECFDTNDLYDGVGKDKVINNIYALSSIATKKGYNGPSIGIKYHSQNKRQFTEEQLIQSRMKGSIPIWNQGDIQIKTKNQDAYGIIKTDKSMQTHTGAISKWEMGSLHNDISSKNDNYGIVKGNNLPKHSNVQSKWAKGSIANDISSKNDNYGIVKGNGLAKHSNVQSKWEQGSIANDVSNKNDNYGIVKGNNLPKHSNVPSKWEQGSIANDISSNNDDYGIVKGPQQQTNEMEMEME